MYMCYENKNIRNLRTFGCLSKTSDITSSRIPLILIYVIMQNKMLYASNVDKHVVTIF